MESLTVIDRLRCCCSSRSVIVFVVRWFSFACSMYLTCYINASILKLIIGALLAMNPMENVYRKHRLLLLWWVIIILWSIDSFGINQGILWDHVLGWCCCIFEVELFLVRFLQFRIWLYFHLFSYNDKDYCLRCLVYETTLWIVTMLFLQWFFRVSSMKDMFNSYMLLEYLASLCS